MRIQLTLIFFSLLLTACVSVPRFTSGREKNRETYSSGRFGHYTNNSVLETDKGIASFYADQFHGRITYGGEVYDMYGYSAAHPNYPMGTVIRVTNNSNGKSVIIPVNDRMPYRPDRIIDLSYGTAEELEMVDSGIIEVTVEVLKWGTGKK